MIKDYTWMAEDYFTQYLDVLNVEFLKMKKEKRVKHLTVLAKRLTETNSEKYLSVKETIMDAANKWGQHPDEIRLQLDYPDPIEW